MARPNQIEKSLASQMIEEQDVLDPTDQSEVSIGVVNPESIVVETEDGGVEIDFDGGESVDESENLADMMEEDDLSSLASELIGSYEDDRSSRSEWEDTYTEGLELLGIKSEVRTPPFDGATGVTHPILSEAVIRFV